MPKQNPPTRNRNPDLIPHQTAHLHTHDQTPRLRFQQPDHALTNSNTGLEIEMMQKQAQVDDIHLTIQAPEQEVFFLVEDVAGEEGALERAPVAEELEAEVHEVAVEVRAVDVLRGGSVRDELAHVLREAAA
ncbi:MAG: hypothetical protein Q9195_007049 [Heterodermia aff. obscurata]